MVGYWFIVVMVVVVSVQHLVSDSSVGLVMGNKQSQSTMVVMVA